MLGLILNASLVALAAGAAFHQPGPSSGCDIPPGTCRRIIRDWNWSTGGFGCKCIEKINIEPVDLEKFRQDSLRAHNAYRSKHGVPALKLSDKINAVAQEWADYLIANDAWQHSGNKKYGENLYISIGSSAQEQGQRSVDSWYSEIKDYKFENPGYSQETGHFTQVVWKGSTELGVGVGQKGSKVVVVANYSPPGNSGQYHDNVPYVQYQV